MRRKLTQKQRREINRKNKSNTQEDNNDGSDNDNADTTPVEDTTDTTDECPICLECLNTGKTLKLQCGHKFHLDCLNKYNSSQLEDKSLNITFPLNDVRKNPNEPIHMIVYLDESCVIYCACCRTEHIMIGKTDKDGDIVPKKILARIRFAEFNGIRPVHFIVDFTQLSLYMPKSISGNIQRLKFWAMQQEDLIDSIKSGECTDLEVIECTCSNRACPRVFVITNTQLNTMPPCRHAQMMCVANLRKHVVDMKTMKDNFKLLQNLT